MPIAVDELSILLGEIKARLTTIERRQEEESINANQHRSDLRIVIASQSTSMLAMKAQVDELAKDFIEVKLLTDDYRETRAQARGAAKVVLFFRMITVALAAAVGGIITWMTGLRFGH
jgi:hypothetical protein